MYIIMCHLAVMLFPDEVVANEDDPPRMYCVRRGVMSGSGEEVLVRVEIVDADGKTKRR